MTRRRQTTKNNQTSAIVLDVEGNYNCLLMTIIKKEIKCWRKSPPSGWKGPRGGGGRWYHGCLLAKAACHLPGLEGGQTAVLHPASQSQVRAPRRGDFGRSRKIARWQSEGGEPGNGRRAAAAYWHRGLFNLFMLSARFTVSLSDPEQTTFFRCLHTAVGSWYATHVLCQI